MLKKFFIIILAAIAAFIALPFGNSVWAESIDIGTQISIAEPDKDDEEESPEPTGIEGSPERETAEDEPLPQPSEDIPAIDTPPGDYQAESAEPSVSPSDYITAETGGDVTGDLYNDQTISAEENAPAAPVEEIGSGLPDVNDATNEQIAESAPADPTDPAQVPDAGGE